MRGTILQRVALLCGCGAGVMASPLVAAPVIAELFYDAAGSDAGFVFVELFAAFVTNADLIADVDYQNGADSVILRDGVTVLDAVAYGSFGAGGVFSGEGGAAPDPAAGGSIARFNPFVDNNDNSVDFIVLDMPPPGMAR